MAPVARRLSAKFGILEPFQTGMSVTEQVEELQDVLASHGDARPVLIGHSWGAWLSLLVAARFPELVRKLILVSAAAFDASYVAALHAARMERLEAAERAEFKSLIAALTSPGCPDRDVLLARVGKLADKADAFAEAEDSIRGVLPNGEIYRRVWGEAAELRKTGKLLEVVRNVRRPVVAIHGDFDPTPAAGVREPLSALPDFRFILLRQCGHTPWRERHAVEEFYRVLSEEIERG
jgi:pimeloyl-ACP methyl ester carboxylesterase